MTVRFRICTTTSFSVDIATWSNRRLASWPELLLSCSFPLCTSWSQPYKLALATGEDGTVSSYKRGKLTKKNQQAITWCYMFFRTILTWTSFKLQHLQVWLHIKLTALNFKLVCMMYLCFLYLSPLYLWSMHLKTLSRTDLLNLLGK
jgi:hypothetical protein